LDRVIEALRLIISLVIEVYYLTFFIQEDIIKMAPSRVNSDKKQAKCLIDRVEEDPFCIDSEWENLFQLQVKLQFIWLRRHLKNFIINV
jgi:hypothetical protein